VHRLTTNSGLQSLVVDISNYKYRRLATSYGNDPVNEGITYTSNYLPVPTLILIILCALIIKAVPENIYQDSSRRVREDKVGL
jgi:hypothetical protein